MKKFIIIGFIGFFTFAKARAEVIDCATNPEKEDTHSRVVLDIHDGKVREFIYYCKWRPYTCSIQATRSSNPKNWSDNGNKSVIQFDDNGQVEIIKTSNGEYHLNFKNVDRNHFCKTPPGKINGTFVITENRKKCFAKDKLMDRQDLRAAEAPDETPIKKVELKGNSRT